MGDDQPRARAVDDQAGHVPAVIAAVDARQRAWVRAAVAFLDANNSNWSPATSPAAGSRRAARGPPWWAPWCCTTTAARSPPTGLNSAT